MDRQQQIINTHEEPECIKVDINSKEMLNWLRELGLTEQHIAYLIKTSTRDKTNNERPLNNDQRETEFNFNGIDYIMKPIEMIKKKTLEDWFYEFSSMGSNVIESYKNTRILCMIYRIEWN